MRGLFGDNDGVRIEAREWYPPPETRATGLPLVFVPGGTGHARKQPIHGHAGAMGKLGSRRRRVLAVSRRGTGLSDAPPQGYTPADFAADVRAAISAAGYDRFVIFGHSMGVPISLDFALRYPAGLAGLALGDAPPEYIDFKDAKTFDQVIAQRFVFKDWDEAFELTSYPPTADRAADRIRFDAIRDQVFAENPDGTVRPLLDRRGLLRTVEESVTAKRDYSADLARISVPVLLLVSTIGWSPLESNAPHLTRRERSAIEIYQQGLRDLRIQRLQTEHDLGQRSNPAPLHRALGALLDRLDGVSSSSS